MARKKRKRGKPKGRRIEKNFVTYGGYIPELDMMLSEDGYYFKMYLAAWDCLPKSIQDSCWDARDLRFS